MFCVVTVATNAGLWTFHGSIRIPGVSGEAELSFVGVAQAGAVWTPEILEVAGFVETAFRFR
jgi:hypothetical protein